MANSIRNTSHAAHLCVHIISWHSIASNERVFREYVANCLWLAKWRRARSLAHAHKHIRADIRTQSCHIITWPKRVVTAITLPVVIRFAFLPSFPSKDPFR